MRRLFVKEDMQTDFCSEQSFSRTLRYDKHYLNHLEKLKYVKKRIKNICWLTESNIYSPSRCFWEIKLVRRVVRCISYSNQNKCMLGEQSMEAEEDFYFEGSHPANLKHGINKSNNSDSSMSTLSLRQFNLMGGVCF